MRLGISPSIGFPAAQKTKEGRLLIVEHSEAVDIIACLLHGPQNVVFVFSEIKLLHHLSYCLTVVLNYVLAFLRFMSLHISTIKCSSSRREAAYS